VRDAGVEQDALGGRGLAGIDVRTDADVAIPIDWGCSGHFVNSVGRSAADAALVARLARGSTL
jgi:hypothetical protein